MNATRFRLGFLMLALAANLVLLGGVGARSADACSCGGGATLEEQIRWSDAVFSGEVESIDRDQRTPGAGPPLGRVTFDAKEVWKGGPGESFEVYGYGDGVMCGIEFERGESYLVYAYRSGRGGDGPLETDLCAPTKPLENADDDLLVLGPPEVPIPDTGGYVFSPAAATAVFAALLLSGGLLVARRKRRYGSRAGQG